MKVYRYSVCFGWPRYNQPKPTHTNPKHKGHDPRYLYDPCDHWVADWFERQLELAHDYGERHVNIELYRRERYQELLQAHCPKLADIQILINDVDERLQGERRRLKKQNQKINAQRLKEQGKKNFSPVDDIDEEDCQAIQDLRHERRGLYEAFTTLRKDILARTAKPASLIQLEETWRQVKETHNQTQKELGKPEITKRTVGSWKGKKGADALSRQPVHIQRLWQQLQEATRAWTQHHPFRAAQEQLDQDIKLIKKRLYNTSGLAWDTAGQIDGDATKLGEGPPPKHHRYDGTGALTIQIKGGGMPVHDLVSGASNVARLETLRPLGSNHRRQRAKQHDRPVRYLMELVVPVNTPLGDERTKSGLQKRPRGEQRPILRVPFVLHRPLPSDGVIKRIKIVRKLEGAQYVVDIQFVVDTQEQKPVASSGTVGVVLCQRRLEHGLLVVSALGDDGYTYRLILGKRPEAGGESKEIQTHTVGKVTTLTLWDVLDLWQDADSLQSDLDTLFEDAKGRLDAYIQDEWQGELPAWLRPVYQDRAGRDQSNEPWWRQHHLLEVVRLWEQHGPRDAMWEILTTWRKQDWKIHSAMRCTAHRAERLRLNLYRRFATYLATRYQTLVVPDTDYAAQRKLPDVDEPDANRAWRVYAKRASLGLLRLCLEQRAGKIVRAKTQAVCAACCIPTEQQEDNHQVVTCPRCQAQYSYLHAVARGLLAASGGEMQQPQPDGTGGKLHDTKRLQPKRPASTARKT